MLPNSYNMFACCISSTLCSHVALAVAKHKNLGEEFGRHFVCPLMLALEIFHRFSGDSTGEDFAVVTCRPT